MFDVSAYSVFAFFEYCVVLTNVLFHGTAIVDFGHGSLAFMLPDIQIPTKKLF